MGSDKRKKQVLGYKRPISDTELRGYAAMKRGGNKSHEEKVAEANAEEQERRGYDGRPWQKKWINRGSSSN